MRSRNYHAFIWHAFFLALTSTFTEINTVISGLLMTAGGSALHLGFLTAIMTGIPPLSKILFAGYISGKQRKRPYLLVGINARILALAVIAWILFENTANPDISSPLLIPFVFVLMFIFAVAGSFAGISYTDILGKSLNAGERRHFFVVRQYFQSGGILISALIARQLMHLLPYPMNYVILFAAASFMLLVASGGFWALQEPLRSVHSGRRPSLPALLRSIPALVRSDRNLLNYIILQNISGVGMMLLPFYMALARDRFGLSGTDIGNFLLLQIIGSVLSVKIWSMVNHRGGYKRILSLCLLLSAALPIYAYLSSSLGLLAFAPVFFFSGSIISARHMSFEAVFIDITDDQNRALYAGIAGVSNIVSALIPVFSAVLILNLGFLPVFTGSALLLLWGRRVLSRISLSSDSA